MIGRITPRLTTTPRTATAAPRETEAPIAQRAPGRYQGLPEGTVKALVLREVIGDALNAVGRFFGGLFK